MRTEQHIAQTGAISPNPDLAFRMHSAPRHTEIILDCIGDGVMTIDLQRQVTFMNRALRRLLGYEHQVPDRQLSCDKLVRGTICQGQDCMLQRALCGERVMNYEAWVRHRTGRLIPVSITTDLLYDHEGRLIGLVEVLRDLSLSKELTAKAAEVGELKFRLEEQTRCGNMIGRSPRMQDLFARLPLIAMSKASVLLTGESGTGKDMLAYALHAHSPRKDDSFVRIDCASLSEDVLESELFGHVKGAFTGADTDKIGRFELADRGTVFLDEIGELSHAIQVKLLRVLECGEFERVGSSETIKVDVRVIAATNRDLRRAVAAGAFREDLYYRLRVIPIELPPLRERREDIPLLAKHFIEKFNAVMGKRLRIASSCLEVLERYPFPGNIRELQNIIEHACVCCDGPLIRLEHLPNDLQGWARCASHTELPESLNSAEREAILRTLERTHWRITEAAARLGIARSTLWRKIKQFHLERSRPR
ncbi:MAG: PAS domain S-box protein [Nitrospirae bacterium]|nr:MAG: PAS domain S-box protein [Nitrospirota bacterium]